MTKFQSLNEENVTEIDRIVKFIVFSLPWNLVQQIFGKYLLLFSRNV